MQPSADVRQRADELASAVGRLHEDLGLRPPLSPEDREVIRNRLCGIAREALLAIDALEDAGDPELKKLSEHLEEFCRGERLQRFGEAG